jgi:protein-tyrosine phosphatase
MIHRQGGDLVLTDLHCHILPGVDDGPATMEGALALARAQVREGVGRVVATPHHGQRLRVEAPAIRAGVAALNAQLEREGIDLEVVPGAEVAMARLPDLKADDLGALALGGGGWILLEAPMAAEFPVETAVRGVQRAGFGVLLAHPERCAVFSRDVDRLERLVAEGARTSITASSLTGAFGGTARAAAEAMLERGLVHNVASDAHDTSRRAPDLMTALRAAGLRERAAQWCEALPQELLSSVAGEQSVAPAGVPGASVAAPATSPPQEVPTPAQIAQTMARKGFDERRIEATLTRFLPASAARRMARRAILAAENGGAGVTSDLPSAD